MKLTKLIIENFGAFEGKNEFDLRTTTKKPIILFGGVNGSGKTTIFESIRLCLYGIGFRGIKMRKNVYEKHIKDRFHKSDIKEESNEVSISLEFEYSNLGVIDRFLLKRKWTKNDQELNESFNVFKNDVYLQTTESEQWQEFINGIIPPGISRLFFFDGEEIMNLASDDTIQLAKFFNQLSGLDIVESLQTDLRIYGAKLINGSNNKFEKELLDLKYQEKTLNKELEFLAQDRAQSKSRIDQIKGQIELLEQNISNEGGLYAKKRDKLKERGKEIDQKIVIVKERIRELCHNALPFAIVPNLCDTLSSRLKEEEEETGFDNIIKAVHKSKRQLKKSIEDLKIFKELNIDIEDRKKLISEILKGLENNIGTSKKEMGDIKHHLSSKDLHKIQDRINKSKESHRKLSNLINELEDLTRTRQGIEVFIFKAPSDEVLQRHIKKLNVMNVELGDQTAKINAIDENIRKVEFRLQEAQRKLRKNNEEMERMENISNQTKQISSIRKVLDDYSKELRQQKIDDFKKEFISCLNQISHKKGFVDKIDVDSDKFSITLIGKNGKKINKQYLAAGEKQIYAVATLWTLAKISKRILPFIIDTPLGRLDSEHRKNLVDNFFPFVSHQIIVFSTDAEVDKEYFERLQKYVSGTYHLNFDVKSYKTSVTPSYFWKGGMM